MLIHLLRMMYRLLIFSLYQVFLCSLGWPLKGGGFNFSQRSQYMKDPAHLKLCLDFCKL